MHLPETDGSREQFQSAKFGHASLVATRISYGARGTTGRTISVRARSDHDSTASDSHCYLFTYRHTHSGAHHNSNANAYSRSGSNRDPYADTCANGDD